MKHRRNETLGQIAKYQLVIIFKEPLLLLRVKFALLLTTKKVAGRTKKKRGKGNPSKTPQQVIIIRNETPRGEKDNTLFGFREIDSKMPQPKLFEKSKIIIGLLKISQPKNNQLSIELKSDKENITPAWLLRKCTEMVQIAINLQRFMFGTWKKKTSRQSHRSQIPIFFKSPETFLSNRPKVTEAKPRQHQIKTVKIRADHRSAKLAP